MPDKKKSIVRCAIHPAIGVARVGNAPADEYYLAPEVPGRAADPGPAGRSEARLAYLDILQRAYGTYLDLQREHYARETRWPDAPFWRRRHEVSYGMEPLARRGTS